MIETFVPVDFIGKANGEIILYKKLKSHAHHWLSLKPFFKAHIYEWTHEAPKVKTPFENKLGVHQSTSAHIFQFKHSQNKIKAVISRKTAL